MNVHDAPIGIFDSGLGGLSVAIEVRRLLPRERLLYAADSLFCPYGNRTPEEIRWRSRTVADALVERGAKVLIVACNTATAFALDELRARFEIPIIGLEPAVKPAIELSQSGRIGVLATPRTSASARLHRLIERYATGQDVFIVPGHGLVELVEAGIIDETVIQDAVRPLIEPLIEEGVDTLVLGCTHYPFLRRAISDVAGSGLTLVDSGEAIARRTAAVLDLQNGHASNGIPGGLELLTTGDVETVSMIATRLLGEPVAAKRLALPTALDGQPPAAVAPPKLSAACTDSVSAGA
jgi:glutamate racemase